MNRDELFTHLENETKVLQNSLIKEAFRDIDRADFLDEDYVPEAYEDYAVPIGFGQKIGKPTVTAFMLELLGTERGDQVLTIGSGSGWSTALLAHMVGSEGQVVATEIVPELVIKTEENIEKYDFLNVQVIQATKNEIGLFQDVQYDRILVNAATDAIPEELIAQLKVGGILVIPINDSLFQVRKIAETEEISEGDEENEDTREEQIEVNEYPGFSFDPLDLSSSQ